MKSLLLQTKNNSNSCISVESRKKLAHKIFATDRLFQLFSIHQYRLSRRFPQPDKQDGGRRVRHIAFHMFP